MGVETTDVDFEFFFGGPLIGVASAYDEKGPLGLTGGNHIKNLKFYYDTCYCDLAFSMPSSTVLMGQTRTVTFNGVSTLGANIFNSA